tara:strand:- start:710 stop:1099 length:390 start_codon:yes stop_codon:yes gene_type:complete
VGVNGSANQLTISGLQGTFTGIVANTAVQATKYYVDAALGGGTFDSGGLVTPGTISATGSGNSSIGGNVIGQKKFIASGSVATTAGFNGPIETKTGTSAGVVGDIVWDANYIYVCTAANVWKRSALTAF